MNKLKNGAALVEHGSNNGNPPLLLQWMRENSEMHAHKHTQDWFRFVQLIIRSLKAYDENALQRYFDDHFTKLFEREIPFVLAMRGLTHLRTLMLRHVMETSKGGEQKHDMDTQIMRLITIFDNLFQRLNQLYLPSPQRENQLIEQQRMVTANPETPTLMALRTDGNRFSDSARIDQRFRNWLGISDKRLMQSLNWSTLIHADDIERLPVELKEHTDSAVPIYELVYRLKHHKRSWREVLEVGRIIYNDAGQPVAIQALVFETAAFTGTEGGHIQPIDMLRLLFDGRKDIAFIINKRSKLVHATHRFLKFLKGGNRIPEHPTEPDTFFELLDAENKVVALNFWEAVASHPHKGEIDKKLLLKLRNVQSGEQKIVEFTPHTLDYVFGEPHYILWGRIIPGRRSVHEFADRMATFQGRLGDLVKDSNSGRVYQRILDIIRTCIPDMPAAALLLKTDAGYIYGMGFGFDAPAFDNQVLLSHDLFKSFQEETPEGNIGQWLAKQLAPELLSKKALLSLEKADPSPSLQLLAATLTVGETPAAILAGCQLKKETYHGELDHQLFYLLAQVAAIALEKMMIRGSLVESRINYRAIFDLSQVAMVILQGKHIRACNRRFTQFTGLSPEAIQSAAASDWVHQFERDQFERTIAYIAENNSTLSETFQVRKASGDFASVTLSFLPVVYDDHPSVLCEILEVSELPGGEDPLRQTREMEAFGTMIAGITHDFNNILGAIIPNAEMIQHQPGNSDLVSKRAGVITQLARRAAALTLKLATYTGEETALKIIDLNDVLTHSKSLISQMPGSGIRLHWDLAADLPSVRADERELTEMILSLVEHARKTMPDGGDLRIRSFKRVIKPAPDKGRSIQPGTYACLAVKDSGKGIPSSLQKQIFKTLFNVTTEKGNSGPGFSILQGILKKQDGYILMQSSENKGSTFYIFLPETPVGIDPKPQTKGEAVALIKPVVVRQSPDPQKVIPPVSKMPFPGEIERESGNVTPTTTKTVLVIDDEPHLLDVYETMLKMMNIDTILADSGKSGLRKYYTHRDKVDLVILDYAMPDMTGKDVVVMLKKLNPNVRILMVTGYGEQKNITRLVKERKLSLLPKPFTMNSLSVKVKQALNIHKIAAKA